MSQALLDTPIMIGAFPVGDEMRFLPVGRRETDRAQETYATLIQSFDFPSQAMVLVISRSAEAAQVIPFERAAVAANLICVSADSSPFEGARVEAFIRRFDISAVFGLSREVMDGLEAAGHDCAKLLAGKVVWARRGAYERLQGAPGVKLLRWIEVGPALALECAAAAGAHVDVREWRLSARCGELVISNRLPRLLECEALATGVRASIDPAPCACGSVDPRITLI